MSDLPGASLAAGLKAPDVGEHTGIGFILEYDGFVPGDVGFIINVPGGVVDINTLRTAAAGPELLAACREALDFIRATFENLTTGEIEGDAGEPLAALYSAIAKATGPLSASPKSREEP